MRWCRLLVLLMLTPWALGAEPSAEPRTPAMIEAIAQSMTDAQRYALQDLLGFGSKSALMTLPGVGEAKAEAIIAARPFARVTDVTRVRGIGQTLFAEMVKHAKAGFPGTKQKKRG